MSKTDKTAPWRVRVFNKHDWLEAHHDHRDGECDLPPRPKSAREFTHIWGNHDWRKPQCYWKASHEFWCVPENRCGCPMCSGKIERKAQRRKERHDKSWRSEW